MATPELTPADSSQLQRRVLALSGAALEGTRELSDVLGEAFRELRSAVACIHHLNLQLEQKEEALRALHAELEVERRRPGAPAAEPAVAVLAPSPRSAEWPAAEGAETPQETVDLLQGPVPGNARALTALLRERIAGALYLGVLRPGDRLPSIRDLSRRCGLNHKTIRRVYQDLEKRGLVTVRDRSGIYVNQAEPPLAESLEETEAWLARVLVEATERGMAAVELPAVIAGSTAARPLRCACVESTEDDRFALCQEIGERFGIATVPVGATAPGLAQQIRDADFVVTTPFHAAEVRTALGPLRPLVVTGPSPRARAAVLSALEQGECVVACVDPAFADRLLHGIPAAEAPRVRVVALGGDAEEARLAPGAVGVATRAAWSRIGGQALSARLSVPPYLTPRAAQDIAGLVVRLNRAADGA